MSFRGFTIAEMLSVTASWVTPEHAERLALLAMLSTVGVVRLVDDVHADLLALLTDEERARLGLLQEGASLKDVRHDTLARIIWYCLLAHEHLHGDTPAGQAVTDVKTTLFPDNLKVVSVGYRESAGRATGRASQLTPERRQVLADIPVQGSNLLVQVEEWNQVGVEMGAIQDQRVTPQRTQAERNKRRVTRFRWVRVMNTLLGSLQLEAEENPTARSILDRVAGIQAEVRRRRAVADGNDDGADDDVDDELVAAPGQVDQALHVTVAQNG
jgi:hypothetical protein